MFKAEDILKELVQQGSLRSIEALECHGAVLKHQGRQYVNLSSNDYLGLSSRIDLQQQFFSTLKQDRFWMSNPSSRLMCGNSREYEELEKSLAQLYETEAALVIGSGFLLNSSILKAVTDKLSVVVADKLVHASIQDGLRLTECTSERFRHNDCEHLEKILSKYKGRHTVVVIESLYSMDGDIAPFDQIVELQRLYDFELLVDEAHAFGVFGDKGQGLAPKELRVDYTVATLGKACASTGAFVACNKDRREMLVNKMRSVIFSTALPPINLGWSKFVVDRMPMFNEERAHLQEITKMMNGQSQIIPIEARSNEKALELRDYLRDNGFWATAIRHPTVPRGTERVRISLTAAHKTLDIKKLCKLLGL